MDIKLTNTGAIPLKDFPSNQCFLVIEEANSIPMVLLAKSRDRLVGNYGVVEFNGDRNFLAWEPIEFESEFCPYEQKELWLVRPDFTAAAGWIFKDFLYPEKTYVCSISDPDFVDAMFRHNIINTFGMGDVFRATIDKEINSDGFYEIHSLRRVGSDIESFRRCCLGR